MEASAGRGQKSRKQEGKFAVPLPSCHVFRPPPPPPSLAKVSVQEKREIFQTSQGSSSDVHTFK